MTAPPVDVLIQGGTVVTEGWVGDASVVVSGGRVAALLAAGDSPAVAAERVVDARGMLVLPGGVDPHCHVGLPLGAYTTRDGFWSASLAALAGGTTTMVDFAIPRVGQHPLDALDERAELAAASRCDYAFHGCFSAPSDDVRDTVHELAARGVRTVKLFTTYRDLLMVDTATIAAVMSALREVSGLTYVHAEANDLVERAQREAVDEGRIGAGVRAYSESCPHYLTLDDGRYATPHPERWVCCPPLRDRETVDALARSMQMGFVDTVGSDHCCYDSEQKLARADDVREMPNGLPGVETRISVVFSELVVGGRLSLRQLAAVTAANPARLNGLYPRKGTIAPGSDADLVVLDPTETRRVHAADLHMETDYSPYEGLEVTGWPVTVLQRGRVVVDGGEVNDPGPVGTRLHAEALDPSVVGR